MNKRYDYPKRIKAPYSRMHITLQDINIYRATVIAMVKRQCYEVAPIMVAEVLENTSPNNIKVITRSLCKFTELGLLARTDLGGVKLFRIACNREDMFWLSKLYESYVADQSFKISTDTDDFSNYYGSDVLARLKKYVRKLKNGKYYLRYVYDDQAYDICKRDDDLVTEFVQNIYNKLQNEG